MAFGITLGASRGSLGVSGGVPGRPRDLLGEEPGGTENADSFLQGVWGGHLVWFWLSGVVLGINLGDGHVGIISLTLAG